MYKIHWPFYAAYVVLSPPPPRGGGKDGLFFMFYIYNLCTQIIKRVLTYSLCLKHMELSVPQVCQTLSCC